MQGQVFVQYTRIGGQNINEGIAPLSLDGSTDRFEEDANLSFTVQWQLPGGIMQKGVLEPEGAWGYILGRDNIEHETYGPFDDYEFCDYLSRTYGYKFDANFNLDDSINEAEVTRTINKLVSEYFFRVFWNASPDAPEYNWNAMNTYYKNCMFI